MMKKLPRVVGFDIFGTVVDWRSGVVRDSAICLARIGRSEIDAESFADAWRAQYIDVMRGYLGSGRDFVNLDVLHREMLEECLRGFAINPRDIGEELLNDWNRAWHGLDPWPDAVAGIARIRQRFPVVTLTNGNIALMLALARRAGLEWDALLGAEVTRAYKPDRQAYLGTAQLLGIDPADLCLVASHHSDLAAARACGLATAYIERPLEYGGRIAPDAGAAQSWDWSASDLGALANLWAE